MSDTLQFDDWCKRLCQQSGLSYPLVFKPHLQQIKDNWDSFTSETSVSLNEVMVALLQHNLSQLLVELAGVLCPQMRSEELLLIRLRMFINCGIALNMQGKLDESEKMYMDAMQLVEPLFQKTNNESYNIIASLYYNYTKLQYSKGNKNVSEHLEKAIHYFTLGGYKQGLASAYSFKAVLLPLSLSKERIDLFLKAAILDSEVGAANDYAMRLANVGIEFINIKEYTQGIGYLKRALEINLKNYSAHHLGMNYLMLANAYVKSNEFDKAKGFCDIARRELEKANIFSYQSELDVIERTIQLALNNEV